MSHGTLSTVNFLVVASEVNVSFYSPLNCGSLPSVRPMGQVSPEQALSRFTRNQRVSPFSIFL